MTNCGARSPPVGEGYASAGPQELSFGNWACTGGARGIGYATALALIAAEFDVAIASLESDDDVADGLSRLQSGGRQVHYFSRDISNLDDHTRLIANVAAQLPSIASSTTPESRRSPVATCSN